MKILFDHQAFKQRFGGVSRYHYELAKGLIDKKQDVEISIFMTENEYLINDVFFKTLNLLGRKRFKGRDRVKKFLNTVNQQISKYKILKNEYDIFHPTYYDPYFLKYLKKPVVLTVHDFVHEKFMPYQIEEITNKKLMIEKADRIIAISENTKSDIISYYSVPEDKISVVYHGFNKPNIDDYLPNIYGNYILFVGRRDGYKNFERFLLAISRILREDDSLKLICTGTSFSVSEIEIMKKLQILGRVVQVSANEKELNSFYANALVFVFPSLYEGFGMPILEAFANNCPICISNTSCFPEIAKNAAMYFDPYKVDSIYEEIKKVIYNEQIREKLRKEGHLRLLDFSWEKTTNETFEIYKMLI